MFLKIISKLRFLHTIASYFVSIFPFFIIHNFSKYHELRKTLKIIEMDDTDGDYCEFGCFTGASLTHSLRITSGKEFFFKKYFMVLIPLKVFLKKLIKYINLKILVQIMMK